jgi:Ca-activated chloride channel family protein
MNLGVTSNSELVDLTKEKKESGVFLTTLGYGSGNYSDSNMESIADAGNGNYYYIDCLDEAKHVLVEKLKETTITVAKDVKMQVEFNPNYVAEYRLIGYENRVMNADDFEDDTKDGGEVGAGQQVTVCYELILGDGNNGKDLKYQDNSTLSDAAYSNEILTLSVNYKEVDEDKSQTEEYPILDEEKEMSEDFSFVVGVIETAMVVRDSDYKGTSTIKEAIEYANNGSKDNEYREEFAKLIKNLDE